MRCFRRVVFACALLWVSLEATNVRAQWHEDIEFGTPGWPEWLAYGALPFNLSFTGLWSGSAFIPAMFFFDPLHGVVATEDGGVTRFYWITQNGTWNPSTSPRVREVR